MSNLILHCGGRPVNRQELALVPVPEKTLTYTPVAHLDLIQAIEETARQYLPSNYYMDSEQLGVARDGRQMFGVMRWRNGSDEMGLAVGFRNSYDQSMSVGLVTGGSVFVCDNLALNGSIRLLRKHTLNVWRDLLTMLKGAIIHADADYGRMIEFAATTKQISVDDDQAYRLLGLLAGREILGARQFQRAISLWREPDHEEFKPRNLWSLYNNVTEALKASRPTEVMERHVGLHGVIDAEFSVTRVMAAVPANFQIA